MKNFYSSLSLIILFISCGTRIDYLGNTYTPTDKVDVYVDESAIKLNYDIVGKGYVKNNIFSQPIVIQKKAIMIAKLKGADAVLIQDFYMPVTTAGINTVMKSDSVGKSLITTGTSTVNHSLSTQFHVLFIKYNK